MTDRIAVILVDDHHVVREGLLAFLSTQPDIDVVGDADSGDRAIALARELRPDIALVDLIMGEIDGVETTRHIKRVSPTTRVVILTSYDDKQWVVPALQAGASSYVLKDLGAAELSATIRRTHAGESVLHPRVAGHLVDRLRDDSPEARVHDLTDREREILRLIADGRTNSDIATELVISEKTVKGHIGNIFAKLQVGDRTQAAVLAWRAGLAQTS